MKIYVFSNFNFKKLRHKLVVKQVKILKSTSFYLPFMMDPTLKIKVLKTETQP